MPDDAKELLKRFRRLSIRSKKDLLKHLHLLEIRDGIEGAETIENEEETN